MTIIKGEFLHFFVNVKIYLIYHILFNFQREIIEAVSKKKKHYEEVPLKSNTLLYCNNLRQRSLPYLQK